MVLFLPRNDAGDSSAVINLCSLNSVFKRVHLTFKIRFWLTPFLPLLLEYVKFNKGNSLIWSSKRFPTMNVFPDINDLLLLRETSFLLNVSCKLHFI